MKIQFCKQAYSGVPKNYPQHVLHETPKVPNPKQNLYYATQVSKHSLLTWLASGHAPGPGARLRVSA